MVILSKQDTGKTEKEGKTLRFDRPMELALLTAIPAGSGTFSIQLPSMDWEDGLKAVFTFSYDGKAPAGSLSLPASMRVVPVQGDIASHCMDAVDGKVTEDCELHFEEGRPIDIQTAFEIHFTGDEIGRLNAYLAKWSNG